MAMATQLEALCADLQITCESTPIASFPKGWDPASKSYACTLTMEGRRLVVPFTMGPAHKQRPTAADVLYCILSDARSGELSFLDFCSEFGFDNNLPSAHATWKACRALAPRVAKFVGEHREALEAAEH